MPRGWSRGWEEVLDEFQPPACRRHEGEKVYEHTDFTMPPPGGDQFPARCRVMVVADPVSVLQNWKATLVPGIAIPWPGGTCLFVKRRLSLPAPVRSVLGDRLWWMTRSRDRRNLPQEGPGDAPEAP